MAIPNEPLTRTEQYLNRTAAGGGTIPDEPLTRVEMYLNKIATGDGDVPEVPLTRMEQYLAEIAENGGGGVDPESITLVTLNVSQNGTTNAPSGTAYNKVVANVPNSYGASDEGKVVSNGSLVSQTAHAEVTQNGTIDTTLNNSVVVNVPMKEALSWHQCPEAVRNYLANVDYTGVPYTQSSIETYAPNPAVAATNSKPIGETIDGVTYYNTVPNADTPFATANKAGTLNPLDHVRWIKSATSNMRDLGGWACDGGMIRYGRIYRSGGLQPQDEDLVVNQLGIQTEIDLEGDNTPAYSDKLRYFAGTGIYYTLASRDAWRTNLRGVFDAVRYGGSVIIHCNMGADRTGTLVCILEALLGVGQSDLDKDYELTSFYYAYRARNGNYQGGTSDWAHLMAQIEALDGATIRDKVVRFALDLGFTVADINTFRHDMIDGNPGDITMPTYSVTNALTNCSSSNAATSVEYGGSYSATITPNSGYTLDGATVQITMGGTDITSSAYSNGAISIASVTGNVVITVTAVADAPTNLFDASDENVVLRGRFNSSHAAVVYADGQLCTGYIEAAVGDTFRLESDKAQNANGYTGVYQCYSSDGTYIGGRNYADSSAGGWTWDADSLGGSFTVPSAFAGAAKVRLCIAYTDINNIKIYKQ